MSGKKKAVIALFTFLGLGLGFAVAWNFTSTTQRLCILPEPEKPTCVISHHGFLGHVCKDGVWTQKWHDDGGGWQDTIVIKNLCPRE